MGLLAACAFITQLDFGFTASGPTQIDPTGFLSTVTSPVEWADLKKLFDWVADANRLKDKTTQIVLPTSLMSWEREDFTGRPAHFEEEVDGFS